MTQAVTASGEKDAVPEALREAWEERAAIIAADGHLTHAEAERLAWAGLQPARERIGNTKPLFTRTHPLAPPSGPPAPTPRQRRASPAGRTTAAAAGCCEAGRGPGDGQPAQRGWGCSGGRMYSWP